MTLAWVTGWLATALMIAAALVPLLQWLRHKRRAEPQSRTVTVHYGLGLGAAGLGFFHPLTALFSLGTPEAIGGGVIGLAFGGVAFVVLLAHTGLGLKLRDPKLRKRPKSRRAHFTTAMIILVAVGAHAAACILGAD